MNLSLFLSIIGGILIVGSFIPYIKDIVKGDTKPHIYTWFIWSITHIIAALAIFTGSGGAFAALSIASGGLCSFVVFLLSLKHGAKNITTFDTITLVAAILAIGMWWKLHHPDWAVITIATVDLLGFLPTFRKTWITPGSESLFAWSLYALGNVFALVALTTYSIATSFYIAAMIIASTALIGVILHREKFI